MAGRDDRSMPPSRASLPVEQIVGECFVKAAHIILGSRVHRGSQTLGEEERPKKCWFNLQVDELPAAQEQLLHWRRHITQPMLLEIWQPAEAPTEEPGWGGALEPATEDAREGRGTLLEVWALQWQQELRPAQPHGSRLEPAAIYKRLVIMLRSLFTHVRILPAYKVFRAAKRDAAPECGLSFRLTSGAAAAWPAGSGPRRRTFRFTPIETPFGTFQIAVEHQPPARLPAAAPRPVPASPHANLIPDYVGSGRLRSTPSADLSGAAQGAVAEAGRPGPGGAAQPPPLLRRHSWSLASARGQAAASEASSTPPSSASGSGLGGQADSGLLQAQGPARAHRGTLPSGFAPQTPKAAATPPKYPSGGLAARVARLAGAAAGRVGSPSAWAGAAPGSGRGASPARPETQEMRTLRPAAPAPAQQRQASGGAAEAAGGSGARPSSQPVRIPGCEAGGGAGGERRLRSSGDLHGMAAAGQAAACAWPSQRKAPPCLEVKPSSAPAAPTRFGFKLGDGGRQAQQQQLQAPARPSKLGSDLLRQPATPPALAPLPSAGGSESGGSLASSLLASGSPQLPFALTPTTASFLTAERRLGGAAPGPQPAQLSRRDTGPQQQQRQQAAGASLGSEAAAGTVGYSVSPMLDSLGSSLFGSSTPQAGAQLPFSLPSPTLSPLPTPKGGGSGTLTLACPVEALLASDDMESDSLPFALDAEPPAAASPPAAAGAAPAQPPPNRSFGLPGEPDAAVGAFVRLLQDAPPLRRQEQAAGGSPPPELSLAAGLEQLQQLRLRIAQLSPGQ